MAKIGVISLLAPRDSGNLGEPLYDANAKSPLPGRPQIGECREMADVEGCQFQAMLLGGGADQVVGQVDASVRAPKSAKVAAGLTGNRIGNRQEHQGFE